MNKIICDWSSKTIEECCDILDNKRVPVNSEEREKRSGIIPYYGANGLQGYIDDYIFNEPLILIAEDGGSFNKFGSRPIAYRIEGKSWVNNHAHVLRGKKEFCQNAIFYLLEHKDIQSYIVGGTRSKLNKSDLCQISILIPNCKIEQRKIAEILQTVDECIEQTQVLIVKQQQIKTGLVQNIFTKGIDKNGNIRSEETHEFKDSPLGRIPLDWDFVKLKALINIKHGYAFEGNFFSEQYNENILLTPGNFHVDGGLYFTQNNTKYYFGKVPKDYILSNGDIVVVMTDLTKEMAILGKTAIVQSNNNVLHNQRIGKIQILKSVELDSSFLIHLMNSDYYRNLIKKTATGTTVRHTSPERLLEPVVPLPNIDEQVRMRLILNTNDELILKYSNELAKMRQIKMAIMQDLLTGRKRVTTLLKEIEVIHL